MYYSTHYSSSIGNITLASNGESLVGLWIEGQKYYIDSVKETMTKKDNLPIFIAVKSWLNAYFRGEKPALTTLPLAPEGSDFRKIVWDLLCEIPYGQITTYGEIAKKVAAKLNKKAMSGQAIGGAVGHNPISIIIPCHRVVGAKGNLTGYAGGLDKKIKLLQLEGLDTACFYVPSKGTAL